MHRNARKLQEARMQIEMTMKEIIEAEAGFLGVLREHLPTRLSIQLGRIYKRLRPEKEIFEETMTTLAKRCGQEFSVYIVDGVEKTVMKSEEIQFKKENKDATTKVDPQGRALRGLIEILPENEEEYRKQRESALATKIPIEFTPIDKDLFDDISTDGNALVAISQFIAGETEEKTAKEEGSK
jgi:hypothetical protein